jgi:hypothetical protein
VIPPAADFTWQGRHCQSPGCPGQLHRLCAGHLGGVPVAVQSYKPDQAFYKFLLALEMDAMLVIELIFLAMGLLLLRHEAVQTLRLTMTASGE